MWTEPALAVPLLALATTAHLAGAVLRNHRRRPGAGGVGLVLVASVLAVSPWILPSPAGVGLGLGLHALWFAVGERTARGTPASPAVARPVAAAPRPIVRAASAGSSSRPKGFVPVPVLAVFDDAPDIRTFRLARPDGFEFQPGQFLTVRVRAGGQDVVRCYSISSPPAARGYLEISVKRQGRVSNALHATLRPGSLLGVRPPAGGFVYPADDDRPLALLAGGIGITPLISMLRHAVLTEPTRPVTLIYSARREADFAFRDELALIAARHPQVKVHFAASREALRPDVYPGRIDRALLDATVANLAHSISLICGPQTMIDELTTALGAAGVPPDQVRSERFEAAIAVSSRSRATAADEVPGDAVADTTYRLHAVRCARTVRVRPGQTLLDAAEAHDIAIDSLCRAGVCGTCRTRVVDGQVDCDSGALDDDDRAQGFVLACVATVRSDCAIEA